MTHLTVDDIMEFVSLTELNSESLKLAATVNGHIRNCKECRELVNAYQTIHDEFLRLNSCRNFKSYMEQETQEEETTLQK